jgi:hypothetical protein
MLTDVNSDVDKTINRYKLSLSLNEHENCGLYCSNELFAA